MTGTKQVAQRIVNAENSFIISVMEQFGKSESEAKKILNVFLAEKVVKIDPVMGQFQLVSGVYWDLEVMNNALELF